MEYIAFMFNLLSFNLKPSVIIKSSDGAIALYSDETEGEQDDKVFTRILDR